MTYTAEEVATIYWATFATGPRHSIWNGVHWEPRATEPVAGTIVDALAGDGPPLSTYFLSDDATTHCGAIDVDDEHGWEVIEKTTVVLTDANVICYPEHSRRGGHLWIVADLRLPAIVMRYAMMAAVERAGFDPSSPSIEIRPSTHRRTSDYAGGALPAPWMAHPATGQRYGLLDPHTLRPLHPKIAGALIGFQQADHRAVSALAEGYMPASIQPQPRRPVATSSRPDDTGITAILEREWGIAAHAGQSIKCPLHDDRHPSFKIAADDRRAWCHSPACVAHEGGRGITPWRLDQLAKGVAA